MTLPGPLLTTIKLHGRRRERDWWAPAVPSRGLTAGATGGRGKRSRVLAAVFRCHWFLTAPQSSQQCCEVNTASVSSGVGPSHASSSFLRPTAGVLRTHVLHILGCCKVLFCRGASPAKGAFSLAGRSQLCRRELEKGHHSCHFCRRMDKLTVEEELKFSPESATWHSAVWTDYGPAPGGLQLLLWRDSKLCVAIWQVGGWLPGRMY